MYIYIIRIKDSVLRSWIVLYQFISGGEKVVDLYNDWYRVLY